MGFANNTSVTIGPSQYKPISMIVDGDMVYAASPNDTDDTDWRATAVTSSLGNDGHLPQMMFFTFNSGENQRKVVASNDQIFLTPDKKTIRANELEPGTQLLDANGYAVTLLTVAVGSYDGGIHEIAVGNDAPGHLIIAGELLAADLTMQRYTQTD